MVTTDVIFDLLISHVSAAIFVGFIFYVVLGFLPRFCEWQAVTLPLSHSPSPAFDLPSSRSLALSYVHIRAFTCPPSAARSLSQCRWCHDTHTHTKKTGLVPFPLHTYLPWCFPWVEWQPGTFLLPSLSSKGSRYSLCPSA